MELEVELPCEWLCNGVGHLCQVLWPAMVGQFCKELINFVTLNVTFRLKGQAGIQPDLVHHTSFDIPIKEMPNNPFQEHFLLFMMTLIV